MCYIKWEITIVFSFVQYSDLNWFEKFVKAFNGTVFFDHSPIKATVELDACLVGLGGRWKNQVYYVPLADQFPDFNIVHLEMLNLLVAIRIWGDQWSSQKVVLYCDNQAVVSVLNNGKTHDLTLAAIVRNIKMQAAIKNISLYVVHMLDKNNVIADLPSRWSITSNRQEKLNNLLPNHVTIQFKPSDLNIDWSI